METSIAHESIKSNTNYQVNYLLLVLGRTVATVGATIFNFALSLYVLDLTGSAATFSMILAFSFLPQILVNFFGGVLVDKTNKKRIMVVADIIGGVTVLIFMMIFTACPKSIILFIVYTLTINTIMTFLVLAMTAAIPNLVNQERVAKTNSSLQVIQAISNIAGPIIGAIIYKAFGLKMIFLFYGFALILSGMAEYFLKYSQNTTTVGESKSYFEDIKVTFEYLYHRKVIGFLFIFAIVVNFIFNALMFLVLPFINYHVIKVSGFQLSLIQASVAFGAIMGALYVSTRSDHTFLLKKFFTLFRLQAILFVLWIFPVLPVFSGSNKWLITIIFGLLLVVSGVINTTQNIPMVSYFQLQIPEAIRARVFGAFWAALLVTTPLGLWVYGMLLSRVPWFYVTFVSGILMITLGFLFAGHKYFKQFLAELKI